MALPSHLQVESLNAHIFQGEGSWPGGPGWSPRRYRLEAVTLPPLSDSPSRPWGVRGSSASLLLFWTLLPWAPSLYRAHWICIPRAGMASSARQAHTPMCQQLPPSLCLGRICPAQAGFPACPTHLVIAAGTLPHPTAAPPRWAATNWPSKLLGQVEMVRQQHVEEEDKFRRIQIMDQNNFQEKLEGLQVRLLRAPLRPALCQASMHAHAHARPHAHMRTHARPHKYALSGAGLTSGLQEVVLVFDG